MPGERPRRRAGASRVDEVSAGGVVIDRFPDPSAIVLIAQRGKASDPQWTLPKGHVEPGERPEQTAVREVAEETGVAATVLAELGVIDYWFMADGQRIHKTVHHFVLLAESTELTPDGLEAEDAAWVPLADAPRIVTRRNELDLLARVPAVLAALESGEQSDEATA